MATWNQGRLASFMAWLACCLSLVALWQAYSGRARLSAERARLSAETSAASAASSTTLAAVGRPFDPSAFDRVWLPEVENCERVLLVVLDELSCAVPQARQLEFARAVSKRFGPESVAALVVAKTARFAASWAESNGIPFPVLHAANKKRLFDMGLPSIPNTLLVARASAPFVVASHMPVAGLEELAAPFERAVDSLLTTVACRRP